MATALEATVELLEGMAFQATPASGHSLVIDAAPELGGQERGPRPLELVLLGLGGCTAMDVISILRKMRQEVAGYQVRLHADRAADHPRVFTAVTVEHVIHGRDLKEEMVRRAIELSATRYCPASAMLSKTVAIEQRYRLIDEATGSVTSGAIGQA